MIRFYCQYSFGGFRTFRIYGKENEALADQEVDKDKLLDFPPQCNLYFNYGGAKLLFRTLSDGSTMIALRDIPGVEKDTDGRPINCALQIVGDPDDLPMMRNITLAIINDVEKFQNDFTEGFSFRNGLHYNGSILAGFVKNLEEITLTAPETELADLAYRNGPVFLFVPTSPLFLTDSKLAAKVISELQLGTTREEAQTILQNTISQSSLLNLAGKIVSTADKIGEEIDAATDLHDDKTEENAIKVTETPHTPATMNDTASDTGDTNADKLRIITLERKLESALKAKDNAELEAEILEQKLNLQNKALQRNRRIMIGLAIGTVTATTAFIISLLFK